MSSQKLFSKRERTDKSTSMGIDPEENSNPIMPQNDANNSKIKKKKNKQNEQNENQFKGQDQIIERIPETTLVNPENLENLQKKTLTLEEKIKELEENISKERAEIIEEIKILDNNHKQKIVEIKRLSNEYNQKIEVLKDFEKRMTVKKKEKRISKPKTENEIKKDINLIQTQISIYEKKANLAKDNYDLSVKAAEQKKNKENDLTTELSVLKDEIASLKESVNDLKSIDVEHQHCKFNNNKLIEEYKAINDSFQYEIKRAKQLALEEINEKNKDEIKQEDNIDDPDNFEKALDEEKHFLPKIHNLKFTEDPDVKLEAKIIKRNMKDYELKNSKSNVINLFKKLNDEYNGNDRYIIEANKNIRKPFMDRSTINQSCGTIQTEGNYLFKEYEGKILQKLLPSNLLNSYQNKFETIAQQRKEIEEKIKKENNEIEHENLLINYKKMYNNLRIKEVNQKKAVLNIRFLNLREKANILKSKIKEVERQINKEELRIKAKEKEAQRIQIYFKGAEKAKAKNKIPINQ
jgi:hypothetical protein